MVCAQGLSFAFEQFYIKNLSWWLDSLQSQSSYSNLYVYLHKCLAWIKKGGLLHISPLLDTPWLRGGAGSIRSLNPPSQLSQLLFFSRYRKHTIFISPCICTALSLRTSRDKSHTTLIGLRLICVTIMSHSAIVKISDSILACLSHRDTLL